MTASQNDNNLLSASSSTKKNKDDKVHTDKEQRIGCFAGSSEAKGIGIVSYSRFPKKGKCSFPSTARLPPYKPPHPFLCNHTIAMIIIYAFIIKFKKKQSMIEQGATIMSNIFLSTSLLYLAAQDAGCLDEITGDINEDCDNCVHIFGGDDSTIRGFRPTALIANILIVTGILATFVMPFIGSIIDYTSHRRTIGIVVAVALIVIQGVQIGTVLPTWFIMNLL